ncbi:MAG TPA: MauE/DoxX family redox-associated membrane protein [Solirubrobacteraceae bacterium]|nr:MauE/DoxX family redox-associated membrane protein [Solirubrobacteraceae bacterium]
MNFLVLAAKSGLALMLIVAGSAKLAGVSSFAASVKLFAPVQGSTRALERIAIGIAAFELTLGSASLAFPSVAVINLLVLATACGFLTVSSIGYVRHRGKSCLCFGGLSNRVFDGLGILRSVVIVGLATGVSVIAVSRSAIALSTAGHLLLLGGAAVIAMATYTAARGVAMTNEAETI